MRKTLVAIAVAVYCSAIISVFAQEQPVCKDSYLSEDELTSILRQTLGNYAELVDKSEVNVDPSKGTCYLNMRLSLKLAGCTVSGCSIALPKGQTIGIKAFKVKGCDLLFSALSLGRTVNTSFADARNRIVEQCHSGEFEILDATPVALGGKMYVRLRFARIR